MLKIILSSFIFLGCVGCFASAEELELDRKIAAMAHKKKTTVRIPVAPPRSGRGGISLRSPLGQRCVSVSLQTIDEDGEFRISSSLPARLEKLKSQKSFYDRSAHRRTDEDEREIEYALHQIDWGILHESLAVPAEKRAVQAQSKQLSSDQKDPEEQDLQDDDFFARCTVTNEEEESF